MSATSPVSTSVPRRSTVFVCPPAAGQGDVKDALEARWKTVNLGGVGKLTGDDCELADQIRTKVLPLFTTRNLKSKTECVPHQLPTGGILLNVDVLVPVKN